MESWMSGGGLEERWRVGRVVEGWEGGGGLDEWWKVGRVGVR